MNQPGRQFRIRMAAATAALTATVGVIAACDSGGNAPFIPPGTIAGSPVGKKSPGTTTTATPCPGTICGGVETDTSPSPGTITGSAGTTTGSPSPSPSAAPTLPPSPTPVPTVFIPTAVSVVLSVPAPGVCCTIYTQPASGATPLFTPTTLQLQAKVTFNNGIQSSTVNWTSSATDVASVDQAGLVTGGSLGGTAIITATSTDSLASSSLTITTKTDAGAAVTIQ